MRMHIRLEEKFANDSIYEVLEDLAPNRDYTINACQWQQKKVNCIEYMSPIMTNHGVCFSFNALNSQDMYTDE